MSEPSKPILCLLAASITTTNANAATKGASAAVSAYMAFSLYSVALLACRSFFAIAKFLFFANERIFSFLVISFCGSTGYIIVRMFAGE